MTCKDCSFFFSVSDSANDYESGTGDCVTEKEDAKGKYWLSKPTTDETATCQAFKKSI